MKTNKFFVILLAWMLVLGACQSQGTEAPATAVPPSEAVAASPEATNPPVATETPQEKTSTLTANLSELSGAVDMKQNGQSAFTPASTGAQIKVNGQVQTGDDGKARLDLSSGTIIRVAPSSLFTLVSNEPAEGGGLLTKLKMEVGMIFIILNGGSTEVDTPAGVAAVRGSYLMANYDSDAKQLTLTCLEGKCEIRMPDGSLKEFTDNQKIVISQSDGQWVITFDGSMEPIDFETWLSYNPEAEELVKQAMGNDLPSNSGACSLKAPLGALPLGATPFEWDPIDGAASYILTFTPERGEPFTFKVEAPGTSKKVDLSAILSGGESVTWSVSAVDANLTTLCTSTSPALTVPVPEVKEDQGGEEQPESPPSEPIPTQPPLY
jgi:hypothetical protein